MAQRRVRRFRSKYSLTSSADSNSCIIACASAGISRCSAERATDSAVSLDGTAKKIIVVTILDPVTKKITIPIPVPNVSILRPPMGLRPSPPARVQFPPGMARLTPTKAAKEALGILFKSSDAISATGSLDVPRYGRVLRSRQMVGVRGAGIAYDGFYYVNSVTHSIKIGQYKQNFTLSRDGLVSNTPLVVP